MAAGAGGASSLWPSREPSASRLVAAAGRACAATQADAWVAHLCALEPDFGVIPCDHTAGRLQPDDYVAGAVMLLGGFGNLLARQAEPLVFGAQHRECLSGFGAIGVDQRGAHRNHHRGEILPRLPAFHHEAGALV